MDNNKSEIREHIELYFKEHLHQYSVLEIKRKSYHPADDHLWMVSARKEDGTYAVWTTWNEILQTLNHGHYDLRSTADCEKIFQKYQNVTF